MTMRTAITDKFFVASQIFSTDLEDLASEGFTTIINNRPDDEELGQPTANAMAADAEAFGFTYTHLPVRGSNISEELVRAFQQALNRSVGPVLAHCRSGTRSLTLWTIGEVLDGHLRTEDVISFGAERGFDLSGASNWLRAREE
jgi:uncharacterized protein (TIGR01244 family)